jgi:hypothetical protein
MLFSTLDNTSAFLFFWRGSLHVQATTTRHGRTRDTVASPAWTKRTEQVLCGM